ncbi:hypothetical protein DMA15_34140 [Streptomyces sp. WAC 01529]|uniref:DUF6777 domain-containing protein n=1 Tax=Streptomyces sp. WAC 01529 TaxID=2203205 RepID=UPI000F6DFB3B|nr:DUF6777 domain-containing protein [Streptomyces sp. WAC 01529]AZM56990.1 hypothetical protein DMA15_34140 [Streptomyces sp. WAC 01529]
MRASTRTYATTFAISAALAVAGCSGDGDKNAADGGRELFMQPVAAQGPDPFTDSTAKAAASPPPVTRSPQPPPTGSATPQGTRSLSGGTPGLYGGTRSVGSCDVDKQVRFLTADQAKARAFAQVSGIDQAAIPGYLRGLTPVVLRADTRVTNHGFRGGSATGYQSVLQAGTAVLVDERGLPRVRCACGNPLKPPVAFKGTPRHNGRPWSGYQPARVIVVTPAPQPIINITLVNIVDNTWIERKVGDEHGRQDRPTKPPVPPTPTPTDPDSSLDPDKSLDPDESTDEGDTPGPSDPDEDSDRSRGPGQDQSDEEIAPDDPGTTSADCPSPSELTGSPEELSSPLPPGCPSPERRSPDTPSLPDGTTDVPQEQPDTGGPVPDDPYLSENPLSDSDPDTFDS